MYAVGNGTQGKLECRHAHASPLRQLPQGRQGGLQLGGPEADNSGSEQAQSQPRGTVRLPFEMLTNQGKGPFRFVSRIHLNRPQGVSSA